jgi:hypothetical protein
MQVPALAVAPAAALLALYEAELDAARSFAEHEKADATRRAYKADWRHCHINFGQMA